jgi:hypothetical protein
MFQKTSRRCFEGHGPTRRNETIHSVATANLAVIACLRRSSCDGQVYVSGCEIISRVDGHVWRLETVLDRLSVHEILGRRLLPSVIIDVDEVPSDHGAGHGDMDVVATAYPHDFYVLAPARIALAPIWRVDGLFNGKHESFESAQRGMADTD